MLLLFMQDGQNVCHIVAAIHDTDAVGVAELLIKTTCPLDAVDAEVFTLILLLHLAIQM